LYGRRNIVDARVALALVLCQRGVNLSNRRGLYLALILFKDVKDQTLRGAKCGTARVPFDDDLCGDVALFWKRGIHRQLSGASVYYPQPDIGGRFSPRGGISQ
jgi:hypothetical protein